jgi:hypothetical protein
MRRGLGLRAAPTIPGPKISCAASSRRHRAVPEAAALRPSTDAPATTAAAKVRSCWLCNLLSLPSTYHAAH